MSKQNEKMHTAEEISQQNTGVGSNVLANIIVHTTSIYNSTCVASYVKEASFRPSRSIRSSEENTMSSLMII